MSLFSVLENIIVTGSAILLLPVTIINRERFGRFAPLAEVEKMLDTVVENEGYADVVQFSGGEPTIHPRLFEVLTSFVLSMSRWGACFVRRISCPCPAIVTALA